MRIQIAFDGRAEKGRVRPPRQDAESARDARPEIPVFSLQSCCARARGNKAAPATAARPAADASEHRSHPLAIRALSRGRLKTPAKCRPRFLCKASCRRLETRLRRDGK